MPYPLQAELAIGNTGVKAGGSVTRLLKLTALDLRIVLRGSSLAQLFPLLGIPFPETGPYATEGHLVHGGRTWRYDTFAGRIGKCDIAGSVEVVTGGKPPELKADLTSRLLDLADLGPLDGNKDPIETRATVWARKILIAQLFPGIGPHKTFSFNRRGY